VLILGVIYLVRFFAAIRDWELIARLASVHPAYLAGSGIFWALVMLPVFAGLRFGWRWAYYAVIAALPLYLLYFWLDRVFLMQPVSSDGRDRALPFLIGGTALILIYLFSVSVLPSTRRFFGVFNERRS
jgi:hypothetical protein